MMIKIVDNFLTESYHKELLEIMSSADFPWYYNSNISISNDKKSFWDFGFTHMFWDYENGQRESFYSWFLKSALYQMKDIVNSDAILRSRGDMTMYTPELHEHSPHVDSNFPHFSTVFYVNDSDGDTIFYDKRVKRTTEIEQVSDLKEIKRVSPKANRLVIFEGDIVHGGSSPNKHKNRIIINSNFLAQEK